MRHQQQQTVATQVAAGATSHDDFKMSTAELRYEAPLATFDTDEWNEFLASSSTPEANGVTGSPSSSCEDDVILDQTRTANCDDRVALSWSSRDREGNHVTRDDVGSEDDNVGLSGSLEDLVNTFDAKITKCFRNYNEHVEEIAPVQIRTQQELLADSQTWWTITGNLTSGVPGEWIKNYTLPVDVHGQHTNDDDVRPDLKRSQSSGDSTDYDSDAEYDVIRPLHGDNMHLDDEPVVTADEVINEIESMMEGSSPVTSEPPLIGSTILSAELLRFTDGRLIHPGFKMSHDNGMDSLSMAALSELVDELQRCVHQNSAELVSELARRDELDFEKELKNQFIWLLLRVQKRRREAQLDVKPSPRQSRVIASGYLNTVIPYDQSQRAPSVERLQIYIKILSAINEDSGSVPSLLTDYILNVLCPTTA